MAAQLALYEPERRRAPLAPHTPERRAYVGRVPATIIMCASCHAREARYGFRGAHDDPQLDRPRTLCFDCFRVEVGRRQDAARAVQTRLPLEQTLESLGRRRRRAQIAARHALGL